VRIRVPVAWTVGAVALTAAAAHLWGVQSSSGNLASTGGAVLFVALATAALATAAPAASAGRDGRDGRDGTARRFAPVLLVLGLLALAGAMDAGAVWYLPRQTAADLGGFSFSTRPADVSAMLLNAADASVARQRWYGLVALLAVGCLAAATVPKPRATAAADAAADDAVGPAGSGRRWSTVGIAVAGVLGAGWLCWDLWSGARPFPGSGTGHLVDILTGAWPQLLTVPLAAFAAAMMVRRQTSGGWLAAGASATGLAAFAISAALAAENIAGTLPSKWFATQLGNARSGNTAGVMVAVASDDPHHAVYQFGTPGLVACYAVMAGGILLVAGWLRSRHAAWPTR
jgi:hypothetical protein